MECIKCGQALKVDAVFCDQCGTKREEEPKKIQCQCGNELTPETKFCGKCGMKVEKEAPQPLIKKEPIIENGSSLGQQKEEKSTSNVVSPHHHNNGFAALELNASTTFWIVGVRIASYVGFLAIAILGVYQWFQFENYGQGGFGFILFLLCVTAGFFCVAVTMVFLHMAEDIRNMRKTMK